MVFFKIKKKEKKNKAISGISHFKNEIKSNNLIFKNNLMDWSQFYFSKNMKYKPSLFHVWISEKLNSFHKNRGKNLCLIAPRGSAKSTWITLFYISKMALENLEKYIFIISDSSTQARLLLGSVKENIEFNEKIKINFSNSSGKGKKWNQNEIKLKNEVSIEAFGTGAKIRGRKHNENRPSLIIIDDCQNDENIESSFQRNKDLNWLNRAVLNAGDKKTNIIMVGTALHKDCLVLKCSRNPAWETKIFKSIIQWPLNMDLWEIWENLYLNKKDSYGFYCKNKEKMHEGSKVLWPENESLLDLMKLRCKIGKVAFDCEKQNEPRTNLTSEFLPEYFGDFIYIEKNKWPKNEDLNLKVISIDPSKGVNSKNGDYSAITLLGRNKDRILFCQCDMEKRPATKIIEDTINFCKNFKPDLIIVETNEYHGLLQLELIKKLEFYGLNIEVMPIVNMTNKKVRIRRLAPLFSRREIKFLKGHFGTELLIEQLKDFPNAEYDDGPDSLEMAVRGMIHFFNSNFEAEKLGNLIPF